MAQRSLTQRDVISPLAIVSCCASQEVIEQRLRLRAELHSYTASRGLPFWITLAALVVLAVGAIYQFEKIRNPESAVWRHAASLCVFSALFLFWIRVSNVVFEVAGDFASEFTPVGAFRILGFLVSNPLGAVIIVAGFLFLHPILLNSILRKKGGTAFVVSFLPLVMMFGGLTCYTFYLFGSSTIE
jgi:hypothetical protein